MSAQTNRVVVAVDRRRTRRRTRIDLRSYTLVLPAVGFLFVFFVVPMLYLLRFSFGLDRLAPTPEAAQFTGELPGFSTSLWTSLLGNDVTGRLLGASLRVPLWLAVVTGLVLIVGVTHGRRLTNRRWAGVACAVLLAAPFVTVPVGNHLLRLAEITAADDSLRLFFRSVTLAMTAAAWSLVVAAPLAYYLALVGRRRRYTWLVVILASFLASYLLRILAWKIVLGDDGIIASLLGGGGPNFLLYTQFTVILVLVYLWVPVVVLPIFAALDDLDPRLVEAAIDLGANRWTVLRRVIAPAAAPGLAAGFLLVFIPCLGEYVTPSLVGGTNGYMYGQLIAVQFVGDAGNWQIGSMLAMVLLAVVLFVMVLSARAGGAGIPSIGASRQWSNSVRAAVASPRVAVSLRVFSLCFLVFLYLPIAVLIITSFNGGSTPSFPPDGLSLEWYRRAWEQPALRHALWASVRVAAGAASMAVALSLIGAYALARGRLRGRAIIIALLTLPLVVPPIILGVSLLSLFLSGAIPIGLGLVAIAISHVVFILPYCVLLLLPRLRAIDRRLEEAAHDLGASWSTTFRRVLLPLLAPSVAAAFIIAFVLSMDEVVAASFLTGDQPTYPVYLFTALRVAKQTMLVLPVASFMIGVSLALVVVAELLRRASERRALALSRGA